MSLLHMERYLFPFLAGQRNTSSSDSKPSNHLGLPNVSSKGNLLSRHPGPVNKRMGHCIHVYSFVALLRAKDFQEGKQIVRRKTCVKECLRPLGSFSPFLFYNRITPIHPIGLYTFSQSKKFMIHKLHII